MRFLRINLLVGSPTMNTMTTSSQRISMVGWQEHAQKTFSQVHKAKTLDISTSRSYQAWKRKTLPSYQSTQTKSNITLWQSNTASSTLLHSQINDCYPAYITHPSLLETSNPKYYPNDNNVTDKVLNPKTDHHSKHPNLWNQYMTYPKMPQTNLLNQ